MKVVLLQMDVEWAHGKANREKAERMILGCPGADLYVLPEMFSTGFAVEPEACAEQNGESLEWMREMARRTQAAVCGSVAVKADDAFYNRMYFVKPDREVVAYDKRHLFTYGGEQLRYEKGMQRKVVEWRGFKFLLQVCYDLRFPVFARNVDDYDVAVYVANWPESRRRVWDILLKARAIENQCYVLGVNRVGNDPVCQYDGGTVAVSPYGKVIAECGDTAEEGCEVELDKESLNAFRKKFPVLLDLDEFSLIR